MIANFVFPNFAFLAHLVVPELHFKISKLVHVFMMVGVLTGPPILCISKLKSVWRTKRKRLSAYFPNQDVERVPWFLQFSCLGSLFPFQTVVLPSSQPGCYLPLPYIASISYILIAHVPLHTLYYGTSGKNENHYQLTASYFLSSF